MKNNGFTRILLATDASEEAARAVAVAAALGLASAADVRVVHVWNLEVHHRHGVWDVETRTEAEELIADAVKRLRAEGIDADGEIKHADHNHVAAAVAGAARRFEADLVVVGSRGLSDWQSMTGYSVTHQLLTALDSPLLIVRGTWGSARQAQRVLLAIAGGDDIEPGVRAAAAAAVAPGSEVLVVHVAQAIFGAMGFAYVEKEQEIQETIDKAMSMLKAAGVSTHARIAEPGPVARIVAEAASAWNADLIVVGSSRMSDLGSMLFGSVTHGLLHTSDRPVLVAERIRA